MIKSIAKIPFRGIIYHREDGMEIGSIILRQEHIAFIAGNWCKQLSRKYGAKQELLDMSREHEKRIISSLNQLLKAMVV